MDLKSVPSGDDLTPAPRISGRDRELAQMTSALGSAVASRGRALLVAGEAGIGKTTLAEAFSDLAVQQGASVVWGRCWEAGGAPAFWPWVQALRAALALEDVDAALARARPFVDAVATLMPEVAGPGLAQKPAGLEGDHERFVLFDAISHVIREIANRRPLVLVLEDLHAADPSSLLLLRFIARDVRSSRCLIVGTYREREAQADAMTRDLLADVAREGEVIALHGLSPDAMATVLEDTAGTMPSDSLLSSLNQITEGNPFYATEIMRLLLAEHRVEPKLDLTRKTLPVPSNVSETVLKRVRQLEPDVRELLDVAAVIGREFSLEPLAGAAKVTLSQARSRLAVAESERVIKTTGPGSFVFDHGLIREALYESLSDKKRTTLHGEVASVLERSALGRGGDALAEVAHHYLRAALDDARPPFEYAVRAARRALDVFAYEQAIDLYEEALALSPVASATPEEKSDLLRGLGEAMLRIGRVTEGKDTLAKAAQEAKSCNSPARLADAVIAYGYAPVEGGIVDQRQLELIKEALVAVGDAPGRERALFLARWAHELMFADNLDDAELRDRLSAEALHMIRRFGDERDVGRVLRNRFSVILAPNRLEECMEVADEISRIGASLQDTEMRLMGAIRRAAVFMMTGQEDRLDVEVEVIQKLTAESRQPMHLSPVEFFKACLCGMRSDVASAMKASDEAMAIGPDVPNAMGAHLLQHITWRWQTDGGGDFEPFMRVAMEQRPGVRRTWRAAKAATLAKTGRGDEASALLDETIEDLPDTPIDSTFLALLHGAVETARVLRRTQGLGPLYNALIPFRDQHIVQVMVAPTVYFGHAEWDLGTLASLSGDLDLAESHFEAALHQHALVGARTYLAWTQAELAEMLVRRGRQEDADRAARLVEEARRNAKDLGLTKLGAFIDELPTVTRRSPEPVPTAASMLTEGEYVTITYGDELVRLKSSKGIGYLARLLSSPDQELHVLDVASVGERRAKQADPDLDLASDDAGPLLDAKAKDAYRRRLTGLQEDIDEAELFNDTIRAARAREEMEFIAEQLSGAVGLGGRDRKAASNAERARVNVTKRIKTTINKIAAGAPRLGRHLEATVKTGTFLAYEARLEPTLEWDIKLDPPSR